MNKKPKKETNIHVRRWVFITWFTVISFVLMTIGVLSYVGYLFYLFICGFVTGENMSGELRNLWVLFGIYMVSSVSLGFYQGICSKRAESVFRHRRQREGIYN